MSSRYPIYSRCMDVAIDVEHLFQDQLHAHALNMALIIAATCAALGACNLQTDHLLCRVGGAARDQPIVVPAEQEAAAGPAKRRRRLGTQAEQAEKVFKKLA